MNVFENESTLNKFCIDCEKDLQKAVFNHKFLRYKKQFCKSLFLCVLCLTKSKLTEHETMIIKVDDWDVKASRFPNLFVTFSTLEMRKHCDAKHHEITSSLNMHTIDCYVDLGKYVKTASWDAASLRWNEKNSFLKKEEKTQHKKARKLSQWSLNTFGHDYSTPFSAKKSFDEKLAPVRSVMQKQSLSFIKPNILQRTVNHELSPDEKAMNHSEFLLHAYKGISPYRDLSETESAKIARMSFDEFLSYSSIRKKQKYQTPPLTARNKMSLMTLDEMEDFSDLVTFDDSSSFVETDYFRSTSNSRFNEQDLVTSCCATEKTVAESINIGWHMSFDAIQSKDKMEAQKPDLRTCPLDPFYVDEREEWAPEPLPIIYSPPIKFTSSIEQANSIQSKKEVNYFKNTKHLQQAKAKLDVLRRAHPHFKEFRISSKYKSYRLMLSAVQILHEKKTNELSVCSSRMKRVVFSKG